MLGMVHETMRFGLTLHWSKTIQPFLSYARGNHIKEEPRFFYVQQ